MSIWGDAVTVARLFASDPARFGGVVVRAGAGPVRDQWLDLVKAAAHAAVPVRKMPIGISDERLLGGLDLTATLSRGEPVARVGILAETHGGIIIVPMAERLADIVGHLCATMDSGEVITERDGVTMRAPARLGFILLDEGVGDDEHVAAALVERCAFLIDLTGLSVREIGDHSDDDEPAADTRLRHDYIGTLCATAAAFGIASIRGPLHAVRVAQSLAQTDDVSEHDVIRAARIVLAPRALQMPASEQEDQHAEPPPPAPEQQNEGEADQQTIGERADVVLEAVRASLPDALLAQLEAGSVAAKQGKGSGSGALRKSMKRGRPAGVRRGDAGGLARLHLVETLRAAAPWQTLRQAQSPRAGIIVRRDDFRIRRFAERAEATMIFAVDASGSAAFERLAETKGAVELLLAEAYVRRTHVALIAFRGTTAELLLPPTRSLARAKKCLSALAGGGGTPLASGVEATQLVALATRSAGRTPFVIMMTDGRANIARDGSPGRPQANADALAVAAQFAATGIAAAVIDVSARPRSDAQSFATAMGARYAALPRAQASAMRDLVRTLDPTLNRTLNRRVR